MTARTSTEWCDYRAANGCSQDCVSTVVCLTTTSQNRKPETGLPLADPLESTDFLLDEIIVGDENFGDQRIGIHHDDIGVRHLSMKLRL